MIYVGSLSKSVFPGLRLAIWWRGTADCRGAGAALILRHPPGHAQRTLAYFMALGHYDAQTRLRRHLPAAAGADCMTGISCSPRRRISGERVSGCRGLTGLMRAALPNALPKPVF